MLNRLGILVLLKRIYNNHKQRRMRNNNTTATKLLGLRLLLPGISSFCFLFCPLSVLLSAASLKSKGKSAGCPRPPHTCVTVAGNERRQDVHNEDYTYPAIERPNSCKPRLETLCEL